MCFALSLRSWQEWVRARTFLRAVNALAGEAREGICASCEAASEIPSEIHSGVKQDDFD